VEKIGKKKDVIKLNPNDKQKQFFLSDAKYTAYGGAKAGGKSWALRNKLVLLCLRYPGIQCLLIRKTLKDLHKNHELPLVKMLKTEQKTKRIAVHKKQDKEFHFMNGSILHLGYAANDNDLEQFAGQAYDVIGVEEATQFTEDQLVFFPEINRRSPSMKGEFEPRMYFTCNPGGKKINLCRS